METRRQRRAARRLEERRAAPARAQLDADWRAIAAEALQASRGWERLSPGQKRAAIRRYIKENRTVW